MSTVVKYNNKDLQHASINRYPLPDEYRYGLYYIILCSRRIKFILIVESDYVYTEWFTY